MAIEGLEIDLAGFELLDDVLKLGKRRLETHRRNIGVSASAIVLVLHLRSTRSSPVPRIERLHMNCRPRGQCLKS